VAAAAAAASERSYAEGEAILVEDAPPAEHLFVVRAGSVELVHGDVVIDVLEPGEAFGLASVLTRLAPAFTVRAHEPTTCVLIPRVAAVRALAHPDGAAYIASSLRERLVRTGHAVHALPTLSSTPLGDLIRRPPVFCPPTATVADAARAMTDAGTTAVLVDGPDGLGVVTDADLRERVLAAGRPPESPLAVAVRTPAHAAGVDTLAGEALVALLDAGVHEICVVDRGRPVGLLTAEELVRTEHNPFVMSREIARAADADALAATCREGMPRLLLSLVHAGLSARDVSRVLTVQSDAATLRLIDFALERHGPAPVPWAWFALGSVARREMTLASDQDNALAYADGGGAAADRHFAAVAADVNAGLAACGFGEDNADVLARSPRWRMTASAWEQVFRDCLDKPDRSGLVRAAVAFDFRHVMGGLEIVAPLVAIVRQAPNHRDFVRRLARTAVDLHVPTPADLRRTRFRRAVHTLDLKRGAALPIANLARFHALGRGVTISSTLDRLVAAEELEALEPETATALREAFLIVHRLRLEHHAECVRAGRAPEDRIVPVQLPPLAREELFSALRAIIDAQKKLSVYAPLGI
jgi:CBS domain-containing protein